MIENEIYCYINGFLKLNICKKTSYLVGNKKFSGKMCIPNLTNKKNIFARDKRRWQVLRIKEDGKGNSKDYN